MRVQETAGAAVDVLVTEFGSWLETERGLSAGTVRIYRGNAREFLGWLPGPVNDALWELDSRQVTSFILDCCRGHDVRAAKSMTAGLRALLRFLHVAGHVPVGLAPAVPAVAGWRQASLPRAVDASVVTRLLDSCDRDTATGRRDYAILLLLARLGLRGAEVAGLEVTDIDWRSGVVTIRGKGGRIDQLPLPVDVGEALAAYLTAGRPNCDTRTVFCTVLRPYRRMAAGTVRTVMGSACTRAGLERIGAHRLRHTLATEMLRAGASLPHVGQVLRHRNLLSTTIYAKVDDNSLRVLAQPWPAGDRS